MHLIEYTDKPEEFDTSLNYYMCNLVGIRKTRCEKTNVQSTIEEVLGGYGNSKTKFIYGGGKSIEGIYAYYDAVRELNEQVQDIDYVFVACGTGTTLTGVCAGMQEYFPNAIIHGISVARNWQTEHVVLDENMHILNDYMAKQYDFSNLRFSEEYLCGGYDCTNEELLKCVRECISHEGMIIDPCYSGKAFYGMVNIVKKSPDLYKGKNILFWNTGGLFNILSTHNI